MSSSPTHPIMLDLTVQELYIALGYAWYHSAISIGTVAATHSRIAQACKVALLQAGEPDERIAAQLQAIMHEIPPH